LAASPPSVQNETHRWLDRQVDAGSRPVCFLPRQKPELKAGAKPPWGARLVMVDYALSHAHVRSE
jgi:hypothetical protein